MHTIRLFMMAIDILEKGEICTRRTKEQGLLLKIRNGGFRKEDGGFLPEYFDILSDYEQRMERASKESALPEEPDMEKVEAFVEYVNRKALEV